MFPNSRFYHEADLLSDILIGLGVFHLCRFRACRHGCGFRCHPFAATDVEGAPPIDAQFALVFNADTNTLLQLCDSSRASASPARTLVEGDGVGAGVKILLAKWPETAEENLLTQMQVLTANQTTTPRGMAAQAIIQESERPKVNWDHASICSFPG